MESRQPISEHDLSPATSQRGLGDLAGDFFSSLGISEERYRAAKVALGLDPKCGCPERRKWLNDVGERLGVDNVIVKLAKWMDGRKS